MTLRQGQHSKDSYMNRIQEHKVGRTKSQLEKKPPMDGVYKNSPLMHSLASLVGCVVRVKLRDGTIHEGVFSTFSPEGDIVLDTAHEVQPGAPVPPGGPSLINLLGAVWPIAYRKVYHWKDIVSVSADSADTNFATMGSSDAFTDTAISKFNGTVLEKELEPWDGGDSFNTTLDADEGNLNGWDANDMFRTNAEKYGVTSSYDNSLEEYTVPLQPQDSEEWRAREARASRIAQEIEGCSGSQRNKLDDGLDEEDRFSAVVRTEPERLESGCHTTPRYVTPHKRRNNPSSLRRHNSGTAPVSIPTHKAPSNRESVPEEPVKASFIPPRIEKRIEQPKIIKYKGRTDEIEEFRKFSSNFKLADECREEKPPKEVESLKPPTTEVSKSTLNPNAKAFTPRCQMLVPSPQPPPIPQQQQQPQRLQQQSPIMVLPQVPPMFPTYMPPNAPRFRKVPVNMAPPRPPDMGPPMHVAAATGQPILAPPGGVQYATTAPPAHQQTIPYSHMNFLVSPRVIPQPQQTSQHLSYVETSHQHMPAHHHHLMMPPGYAATGGGQPMGGQAPPNFPPQPLVLLPHQQVTLVPPPYMTQQTQAGSRGQLWL